LAEARRKKVIFVAVAIICLSAAAYIFIKNQSVFHYGLTITIDQATGEPRISEILEGSAAELAGLKVGDVVLEVNEETPETQRDCDICLLKARDRPSVKLKVRRDGEELVLEFAGKTLNDRPERYLYTLIGLVYILMGFWVFFARPQYRAANSWSYFSLLLGAFVVNAGTAHSLTADIFMLLAITVVFATVILSAACVLDFALVFPHPRGLALRRWTIPLLYSVALAVALFSAVFFFLSQFMGSHSSLVKFLVPTLGTVYLIYWLSYIGLAVLVLIATYLRIGEIEEKRRIRWIIFGTAIPLAIILLLTVVRLRCCPSPAFTPSSATERCRSISSSGGG